jgi:hypothetical protein
MNAEKPRGAVPSIAPLATGAARLSCTLMEDTPMTSRTCFRARTRGTLVAFVALATIAIAPWTPAAPGSEAASVDALAVTPVVLTVPGMANPWLAGMPNGSKASSGADVAPQQSPVQVTGIQITGGAVILFTSVTGTTTYGPGFSYAGPDGQSPFNLTRNPGAENNIADVVTPTSSLLGVFLDDSLPTSQPTPARLDFGTAASRDFLTLSPGLKQPFFIGNGLNSASQTQRFIAPAGATRLFLGTMDGSQWNNNLGSLSVTVAREAAAIALLPALLTPGARQGSSPPDETFTVRNSGLVTLDYTITDDADWLSVSPDAGTSTGEEDTITVHYTTTTLSPGTYTATITVADVAAENTPQTVGVTLVITPATGDFDGDGDVDLTDFMRFQTCFNGPNRPAAQENCTDTDMDTDNDVDLQDFLKFQTCYNGPNRPPACAGA